MILGLLTVGSLIWYLLTARPSGDLHLIGTVDANEVEVSSKIPGRIQTLTVEEGQDVKAGDLIAVIESDDLAAAHKAAEATVSSQQAKLNESIETERQTRGETSSQTINSEAQLRATKAALAQAQANLEHQQADSQRTVALAKQGIMSKQASEEAVASLKVYEAAVETARENVAAAEAALQQARAHELQTAVAAHTVASTREQVQNARALADQAAVELGYSKVFAPVTGKVNVVGGAAGRSGWGGHADCDHHGPYADLGVCASAGDAGGRREAGRQPARGDAQRRNGRGQGDCQSRRKRILPRSAISTAAASATSRRCG